MSPYEWEGFRIVFQSLSGFLWRCDSVSSGFASAITIRFNPYRVFFGAATLKSSPEYINRVISFNPYRVFFGAATQKRAVLDEAGIPGFQSLSGFLWRCDIQNHITAPAISGGFNPYRVFFGAVTAPLKWFFSPINLAKASKIRPHIMDPLCTLSL